MKRHIIVAGYLTVALLTGCTSDAPSTRSQNSVMRFLQAQSVGRVWDNGERALQNNDVAGLVAARNELQKLNASDEASRLVRSTSDRLAYEAAVLDAQGYRAAKHERHRLQQNAAQLYRQALKLDPAFASTDPVLLNAVGYFLADRGTTKSDYVLAERLTRRALQGIEKNKDALPGSDPLQRANTRDSLAWALFRQGRFDEAWREQKQVVKEAETITRDEESLRELRLHLRKIEKAIQK